VILTLSIVGAAVVVIVAVARMITRPERVRERDPHRGDIPPDQMAP